MRVKYVCVGGYITSKSDGEEHFIHASRLPGLYDVSKKLCVFFHDMGDFEKRGHGCQDLIVLRPLSSGDYRRPE